MNRSPLTRPTTRAKRVLAAAAALPLLVAVPATAGQLVGTKDLKNKAVTSAKLAGGAVVSTKLKSGAVTTAKLGNGAVTSTKIATGAVGSSQLADGAVQAGDLDPGLQVFSSGWLPLVAADPITYDGTSLTVKTVTAPEVTDEVIASGAVQVFFRFDGSTALPLPYSSFAGGESTTVSFQLLPGLIRVTRASDDNTPIGLGGSVRYVVTHSTLGAGAAPVGPREAPRPTSGSSTR